MKKLVTVILIALMLPNVCFAKIYTNRIYNYQVQIPNEWSQANFSTDSSAQYSYVNWPKVMMRVLKIQAATVNKKGVVFPNSMLECADNEPFKTRMYNTIKTKFCQGKPNISLGTNEVFRSDNNMFLVTSAHDVDTKNSTFKEVDWLVGLTFNNGVMLMVIFGYHGEEDKAKEVFFQILNTIRPMDGRENEIIAAVSSN